MQKSAKSNAEQKFAALQKKEKQAQAEKDKIWQERAEKSARLKALRLAKEAADKEEADKAAADKAAAKSKKSAPAPAAETS